MLKKINFFKKLKNCKLILISSIFLLIIIIILPFFTYEGYDFILNTVSRLGAQNTPYSIVINTAFFILGISIILEVFLNVRIKVYLFFLSLIGIGFILISFFNDAPILSGLEYNVLENQLHLIFAYSIYFVSVLFLLTITIFDKSNIKKLLSFITGINLSIFGIVIYNFQNYAGLIERFILFFSLVWLIIFIEIQRKENRKALK
ncbi:MAG: DUF998 domain-containing protein [Caldisericia bacterium]|nr:DUF998 domain-containing protein [Caldisericia bacterium]